MYSEKKQRIKSKHQRDSKALIVVNKLILPISILIGNIPKLKSFCQTKECVETFARIPV